MSPEDCKELFRNEMLSPHWRMKPEMNFELPEDHPCNFESINSSRRKEQIKQEEKEEKDDELNETGDIEPVQVDIREGFVTNAFAIKIAKLFYAQSTDQYSKSQKSIEELSQYFNESVRFAANLCHANRVNLTTFLYFLKLQRRRHEKMLKKEENLVIQNYGENFIIQFYYQVKSKMNFLTEVLYRIHFIPNGNSYLITKIILDGGCEGSKLHEEYEQSDWKSTRKFEKVENPEMFASNFKFILPFNEYTHIRSSLQDVFTKDFEAIVDTNSNFTYNMNEFLDYMTRFNQRYAIYRDKSRTVVMNKIENHLVFRTDAVFHLDKTNNETWQFQVEAIYNIDGKKGWKLNKLFMRPPLAVYANENQITRQRAADYLIDDVYGEIKRVLKPGQTSQFNANLLKHLKMEKVSVCNDFKGQEQGVSMNFHLKDYEPVILLQSIEYGENINFKFVIQYTTFAGLQYHEIAVVFKASYYPKNDIYEVDELHVLCDVKQNAFSRAGSSLGSFFSNAGKTMTNAGKNAIHTFVDVLPFGSSNGADLDDPVDPNDFIAQ